MPKKHFYSHSQHDKVITRINDLQNLGEQRERNLLQPLCRMNGNESMVYADEKTIPVTTAEFLLNDVHFLKDKENRNHRIPIMQRIKKFIGLCSASTREDD